MIRKISVLLAVVGVALMVDVGLAGGVASGSDGATATSSQVPTPQRSRQAPALAATRSSRLTSGLSGVNLLGPNFADPVALAYHGSTLWVVNKRGNFLTEVNGARTSRTFGQAAYKFNAPVAIASDKSHLWVANESGNSVTELNAATGELSAVRSGASYKFAQPAGIASDGEHVWVANYSSSTVTELNATTGQVIRVLNSPRDQFANPTSLLSDGKHVWVVNTGGSTVTELTESTGAFVRVLSSPSYGFNYPVAAATDGTDVWIANKLGNSVTEISASTGGLVRRLKSSSFGFNRPVTLAVDSQHLWVGNNGGSSISEITKSNASLVRVIRGSKFHLSDLAAIGSTGTQLSVATSSYYGAGGSLTQIATDNGALSAVISSASWFATPRAVVSDGAHVWVAGNCPSGDCTGTVSITEIDALTGQFLRVLKGSKYHFDCPDALALSGLYLWVANGGYGQCGADGSGTGNVEEINTSTGAVVRVIPGGATYGIDGPDAISIDSKHIWIANYSFTDNWDRVTELNKASGTLARVFNGPSYEFDEPDSILSDGSHVWIGNYGYESTPELTELSASTGSLIRVESVGSIGPNGLAFDGSALLVLTSGTLSWLNPSTGAVGDTLSSSDFDNGNDNGNAIGWDGTHLWVLGQGYTGGSGLAEVSTGGSIIKSISGSTEGFQSSVQQPFGVIAVDKSHIWIPLDVGAGGGTLFEWPG